MVALFPQLTNGTNIHHYKEYFMLLQTDESFRDRVYMNETPERDMDEQLFTWAYNWVIVIEIAATLVKYDATKLGILNMHFFTPPHAHPHAHPHASK